MYYVLFDLLWLKEFVIEFFMCFVNCCYGVIVLSESIVVLLVVCGVMMFI